MRLISDIPEYQYMHKRLTVRVTWVLGKIKLHLFSPGNNFSTKFLLCFAVKLDYWKAKFGQIKHSFRQEKTPYDHAEKLKKRFFYKLTVSPLGENISWEHVCL